MRVDRYWEVAPLLAAPPLALDLEHRGARAARASSKRAVEAALVSDVPVGVFLSGGLDSTAIAALARTASGELDTFTLGFDEPGFDERDARRTRPRARSARATARPTITPDALPGWRPDPARMLDEPLADPSLVPTFLLARACARDT